MTPTAVAVLIPHRITAFQVYADAEREVAPLLLGPPEVRRLTPTWAKPPS